MLIIRSVDPSYAVGLFTEPLPSDTMTPRERRKFCRQLGLIALAADMGDELAGFAVAESDPKAVHFLMLEGDTATCRVLLDRLVRLAGERDVSGWCPVEREDVQQLLEGQGFVRKYRDRFFGCPCYLYHWNRNEDTAL